MAATVEAAGRLGLHVKWHGAARMAGFTSRPDQWRHVDSRDQVPRTTEALATLCDLRIPPAMRPEHCERAAAILTHAVHAAATSPAGAHPAAAPVLSDTPFPVPRSPTCPATARHALPCPVDPPRSTAMPTTYLKRAAGLEPVDISDITRTVAEMLRRIEDGGEDATRAYSTQLDGWSPASFEVDEETVARAERASCRRP